MAAAAGLLPDKRIQIWVGSGTSLRTTWKKTTATDSSWAPWSGFGLPSGHSLTDLAVAPLPDGRLQLFGDFGGTVYTCWKTNTSPDAPWTSWSVM